MKTREGGLDGAFAGTFFAHERGNAVEGGLALLAAEFALFGDDVGDG